MPSILLKREATQTSVTDSEFSSTTGYEKGSALEKENAVIPSTIVEDDENEDNVGHAAYLRSQEVAEITPAQNKAILRRIDLLLLPLFLVTQTLQYLDKTALNYAKVFGMEEAINLSGNQYSMVASIFYIGYLVAQEPAAYLLGRYKAGTVLGISSVIWGVCVISMVGVKSYPGALINRFFLGVFEAAVTPGLSLMTGFWYTRAEAPLRQTIWYSAIGWGGMIGALMAAGISKMPESEVVPRWQIIFYILGSITIVWGLVLYYFLADGPSNAPWLQEEYRTLAVARVAANGVGIKSKAFRRYQAFQALKDPKAYFLTIAMFGSSVPNGILTNFSGTIIKGMGFGTFDAALLDCAGRSFQVIALLIAGLVATKFQNCRMLMMTIGNVICVIATALLSFLPTENTWGRLVSFWFVNVQSIGFTLGLVMISSNVGGYTKKSITSAMVFTAYCAGNMAGPQFVFANEAPRYQTGAYAMMAGYLAKLVAHCALWAYMYVSNKNRDKKGEADDKKAAACGMDDKTENENPDFRYVL